MRASVNEKSEALREFRVVASVNVLFLEKNLHPNFSFAFRWCHPNLIVMLSGFLNASSWSSWNILTFGGFSLNFDYLYNPFRNILEGEVINGTCFNFLISKNNFSFLLITCSEKCIAQTHTCLNSWASLRFRNLTKVFLCCSSSGNGKMPLSRVRRGLWSIRERCSCWPFSSQIPLSINNYLFPFHL